jgi:hypothetical protein
MEIVGFLSMERLVVCGRFGYCHNLKRNIVLQVQYHKQGQIIVFDDSKPHRAFNFSETSSRVVLILDLVRPSDIPLGTATGGHTDELDSFISLFK